MPFNGTGAKVNGGRTAESLSSPSVNPPRRDTPVVCIRCGRVVPRKARQQQFCSDTCRERARERSRKAFVGRTTGAPTNPPKKLNGFNRYGGPKSRSSLAHSAVQTEFFGGRTWRTVVSSDGVVS
jgi:predicted nucleic acid-binding Zn ribbon protein